jgi:putative oxidoreductase
VTFDRSVAARRGFADGLDRFTHLIFGLMPASLIMLALRFALAVPFWRSGMTKWDGFLTLSFGAKALFSDEYKLHIFGAEYPYPAPELFATLSALGETCLPVLLVLGLGTRYAALALLGMTAIIQLTVPDG